MSNKVNLCLSALIHDAESSYKLMTKYKNMPEEHNKSMYYIFVGQYHAICEIIRKCGYIPHNNNGTITADPINIRR